MKKRTLTKESVLAAAVRIVEEKGLSALSMQELAGALGILPSSLYNHVSGLDEAQKYIVQFALESLIAAIREQVLGYAGDDALLKVAFGFREFAVARPELYKAICLCTAVPAYKQKEEDQELVRVLHRILGHYSLDEAQKSHFARAFRSSMHGFISLELSGGFKSTASLDESYMLMVKQIISMLDMFKGASQAAGG
ncbi:MAG: TetR/AcrR family transcriptional regulator [Clostridiales Family XIII bacterium]|jgi:AcrR family transcriptional regulator|nr:TetR/AcrR family transcriptional regulator [Clostridiales Family XIII bacterium]